MSSLLIKKQDKNMNEELEKQQDTENHLLGKLQIMDMKTHEAVLNSVREMERSMRVLVKIPGDEEDRIVVNALIRIRNSVVNRNKDMSHFDKVLEHYLTADEFQKYVIEQHEIEY